MYFSGPCFHISCHQSDTSLPRLLLQLKAVFLTYWKNLLDNLKRNQALSSWCWWWTGALPRWNTSSSCGAWEKRGKLLGCSWLLPHEQAICFSSLIWLARNKSVQKSRFSRIVKNSREFSLLDLDLEAFWFHFSLLEKEWKHFDFTLHFSKKSESIFFSLCTSRKRVKAFYFHFSLLELQKPTLAGPCFSQIIVVFSSFAWKCSSFSW